MTKYYGLIFDVDGVIADTEAVNARATGKVFADLFGLEGVKREDFEAGLGRGAEAYVEAAARVHGLELDKNQLADAVRLRQEYFLRMLEKEPLPPFPGVMELISEALRDERVRAAIATSSTRAKSHAVLQSAGIPFEKMAYITGEDVKRKKPDPSLFLTAAHAIEVPPDRCVVIEDAPDGVEAARAAGCKCIAVTNSTTPDKLFGADRIVSSLTEVTLDDIFNLVDSGY